MTVFFAHLAGASEIVSQVEAQTHLGSATCAGSQCHGKSSPVAGRNVHLDEYTVWINQDYHSVAYRTLQNDLSREIAGKLGLESARTAKVCLDCHSDNVPEARRGSKFQISDGVGCEACHGGSGEWIKIHTEKGATHSRNVAAGLIETDKGDVRARLCLSCHAGTKDRFATHRIMAAGHPRLSFEMNLFTVNQPAHYSVDEDYIERKGFIPGFRLWMSGQFEATRQILEIARSRLHDGFGVFPDFAFYDCDSCHHSVDNIRWTKRRADGLQPGTLRLALPNMVILGSLLQATGNDSDYATLEDKRIKLLRAAQQDKNTFVRAVDDMRTFIDSVYAKLDKDYTNAQIAQVRKAVLMSGAKDLASDFAEAEQIIYSFETLCFVLGDIDRCQSALDDLYDNVKLNNDYRPRQFSRVAKAIVADF